MIDSLHRILGDSEMMAYLLMMAPRLLELHRKLKKTGSLYLHCDPVASHYLKVILDVVFGPKNFRNEVVWKRTNAHGGSKRWGDVHDSILFYAKSDASKWNRVFMGFKAGYVDGKYRYTDDRGRYRLVTLGAPGVRHGDSGDPWRGIEVTPRGRHWAAPNEPLLELVGDDYKTLSSQEKLDILDDNDYIVWPKKPGGFPEYKKYLQGGKAIQDVIVDIEPINSQAKERRGYPTQKPLALLERIIASSTDEGDVVLDPFAGCGTAVVAAERMNRRWIGIDITYLAINEVVNRLQEEKREGHELKYELLGTPKDEDAARALFSNTERQNHKPFEQWAITLVGGKYNDKKGADRGIDGRVQLWDMKGDYKEGVVQVKGGNGLNLSNVRDFAHVIENSKAVFGIMIAQREPTKEMKLVAENMGYADWPSAKKIPRYQILTTEGILERGEAAILPESWMIQPDKGVGKAKSAADVSLFTEED